MVLYSFSQNATDSTLIICCRDAYENETGPQNVFSTGDFVNYPKL